MGVSIWEGSKAQALIDAINTQKIDKQQGSSNAGKALVVGNDGIVIPASVGINDAVKNALLACFRNVAWISESGSNYYNTLEAVLDGKEPPISADDYTWKYDPMLNVLLSQYEHITPTLTGATENISNGVLNIHVTTGEVFARYDFKTETNHNAKMNIRVRVNTINDVGTGEPSGVRMQLSNGNSGAAAYICRRSEENAVFAYEGTSPTRVSSINVGEWVDITVELKDNTQVIWVNGEKLFESSTLSTYYCTSNRLFVQKHISQSADLDIAYLSYKNDD